MVTIFNKNFTLASLKQRLLAFFLDVLILILYSYIAGIVFGKRKYNMLGEPDGYSFQGASMIFLFIGILILFPTIEGLTGQTIGKKIVGIKVVETKYGKPTLIGSYIRFITAPFEIFIFFVGYIIAYNNKKRKRIGDFLANTVVVVKTKEDLSGI